MTKILATDFRDCRPLFEASFPCLLKCLTDIKSEGLKKGRCFLVRNAGTARVFHVIIFLSSFVLESSFTFSFYH